MDTYVYELGKSLYINLTNRCSNACTFCVRNGHEGYFGNKLWLQKEPAAEDVLGAIDFSKKYEQVVFCGFGEPTERADVLVAVAKELKKRGYTVRVNTNGQGNLINGRDITAGVRRLYQRQFERLHRGKVSNAVPFPFRGKGVRGIDLLCGKVPRQGDKDQSFRCGRDRRGGRGAGAGFGKGARSAPQGAGVHRG